ncbi:hypothetical protein ACF059_13460 [Streptomyces sp. NPDC016562]|uniref:hypothetical protein n=1 Tax=Streptomyces sp. NPDC016562 TaxID=3364966 RepID=UPI0037018DF7
MKTRFAAALGSVALAAGMLLGAPAASAQTTAYPTTTVDVPYGASYIHGTLTWYNRSVGFNGTLRAVGCRRAWFAAYDASGNQFDARSTSTKCDVTYPFSVSIPADAPGGAASVVVCLDDANAKPLKCVKYYRP